MLIQFVIGCTGKRGPLRGVSVPVPTVAAGSAAPVRRRRAEQVEGEGAALDQGA